MDEVYVRIVGSPGYYRAEMFSADADEDDAEPVYQGMSVATAQMARADADAALRGLGWREVQNPHAPAARPRG